MPVVAAYPNALPSFTPKTDNLDTVFADHVNVLQAEVYAIANALGTAPQGTSGTVKQRLSDIEAEHMTIMSKFNSNGNIPQAGVEGLPAALAALLSITLFDAKGDLIVGAANDTPVKLSIGTTGYVLTADPGAAGGMSWQAVPASGIQPTLFDAKGDLIGASADNTPIRIAVGSTGYVLTADPTAPSGLSWQAIPASISPNLVDAKGDLLGATADNVPARIPVGATNTVLTADPTAAAGVSYQAPHFPIPFHFPGNFTTGYKSPVWIANFNGTLRLARARTSTNSTATYGVAVNGAMVTSVSAAVGSTVALFDFADVNFNTGDYISIQVYDNSSGAATDLSITIDAVAR